MPFTVGQFLFQMYRLINASNPTVPLHGDDEPLSLRILNQLLQSYASSGLVTPIAKTVSVNINLPINQIFFTDPTYSTTSQLSEIVTLSLGSPSFTVADSSVYFIGDMVIGAGIPGGASILSIFGNVITLTVNSTINGASNLTFTHDVSDPTVAYIKQGRLANLDSAWLTLSGVTYPLIDKSRDEYLAAWKYEPLQGLPRFIIVLPETNVVTATLYPAPSQFFTFNCRGKFQLSPLTIHDDMSVIPEYMHLYLLYAVGKFTAHFKGRSGAWDADKEATYRELKDNIEGASEINLSIAGYEQSLLNGAWRIRAGI